jgi:hypothetical protein
MESFSDEIWNGHGIMCIMMGFVLWSGGTVCSKIITSRQCNFYLLKICELRNQVIIGLICDE